MLKLNLALILVTCSGAQETEIKKKHVLYFCTLNFVH